MWIKLSGLRLAPGLSIPPATEATANSRGVSSSDEEVKALIATWGRIRSNRSWMEQLETRLFSLLWSTYCSFLHCYNHSSLATPVTPNGCGFNESGHCPKIFTCAHINAPQPLTSSYTYDTHTHTHTHNTSLVPWAGGYTCTHTAL